MRNRIFGLALIALAVPFPALALDGGGAQGTTSLSVTASLDSCGLAGAQIMCKIDAGWNTLDGAETYSVSVTSADGSVVDMGETTGQSTSVWVPYAGSGSYAVQVTAWGTPPGEEAEATPEVIARSTSLEGGEVDGMAKNPPQLPEDARSEADAETAVEDPTDVIEGEVPLEPREETPVCEEPPVEEPPLPPAPESPSAEQEAPVAAEPEVVDTIPADDDCTG